MPTSSKRGCNDQLALPHLEGPHSRLSPAWKMLLWPELRLGPDEEG